MKVQPTESAVVRFKDNVRVSALSQWVNDGAPFTGMETPEVGGLGNTDFVSGTLYSIQNHLKW